MKYVHTLLLLLALGLSACRNTGPKIYTPEPGTVMTGFEENAETALWMALYRQTMEVARHATQDDDVLADITRTAYAYEAAGQWYATFGRFDTTSATAEFEHLATLRVEPLERTAERVDGAEAPANATAIMRAIEWTYRRVIAPNLESEGLIFDQFVRTDEHDTITAWVVPGWQPNGFILHGRTQMYKFSPDGARVIHQRVWDYGLTGLRANTGKRHTIGHPAYMTPPVGDLYFLLYYGKLYGAIMCRTRNFGTTIATMEDVPHWVHMPASGERDTLIGSPVPVVGPMRQDLPNPLQ